MTRGLVGLGLGLLLVGACAAPAEHTATPAPTDRAATPVAAADAKRAAALGQAACAAWDQQPRANSVLAVRQLRATAESRARGAAALDPRWATLATDLTDLAALESAYAQANVSRAYSMAPKLEALRKRIPTRC
jgi:hypothetical protein